MVLAGWLLVVVGWVLGAASGVLWMRKYPGQRLSIGYPGNRMRGWKSWTLLAVALFGFMASGGNLLQTAYGNVLSWLLTFLLMLVFIIAAYAGPVWWRQATYPETAN